MPTTPPFAGRSRCQPGSDVPAPSRYPRTMRRRRPHVGVHGVCRSERGTAVVEMAVVTSLLMVILLGIVTFGITHYQNISVESASREASRFGATYPVVDAGSMEQWLRDVAQVAENAATGAMSSAEPSREICVAQGTGDDPAQFVRLRVVGPELIGAATEATGWCFENTAPVSDTVVQVQLKRDGWIETIVYSAKPALTGEATNRFERMEP